jgi:hypothetical protein
MTEQVEISTMKNSFKIHSRTNKLNILNKKDKINLNKNNYSFGKRISLTNEQ